MEKAHVQKDQTTSQQSSMVKSPSKIIGGWEISESTIKEEAYKLWESGHSSDSETNWYEAERCINDSLSN